MVANGHYTVPSLPDIKGIREWNKIHQGVISHSKFYRQPQPFAGKKVIVVGNAASGTDITSQIATVSRLPILNSIRSNPNLIYEADYKENVPEIQEFILTDQPRNAVRFCDGRIEADIDAILFCTGYHYSFPFLKTLRPPLVSTGERVQHLFKHIWYIPDPTLAFIGLPSKIIPFRTVEGQSAALAYVWSGRLTLPTSLEMREWEEKVVAERGAGKQFHVLPFPKDFEYHNELISWVSKASARRPNALPLQWTQEEMWLRERCPAIKKAFADRGEERHAVRTITELGFDYRTRLKEQ